MNKYLYDIFNHWYDKGTVWLYSDPHFKDIELYKFRFPEKFKYVDNENDLIDSLDEMQIKNINKVCGKNDTLIILGDIGDISKISKLKAKYKILITGNHDIGNSNYIRTINKISENDFSKLEKLSNWKHGSDYWVSDNKLFDEVYNGPLMISDKIILSHEPVDLSFALNIHGHDHSGKDFIKYVLSKYDADINSEDYFKIYLKCAKQNNLHKINVCSDWINYTPVNLNDIIKSGILKNINSLHRQTIDIASKK